MKKILVSLTSLALLLSLFGTAAMAQTEVPSISDPEDLTYQAGNVPAQTGMQDTILPPIHALVVTMVENDLIYDPESPLFQWTSLYYMLSLYGQMDDRAELTDDTLILPSETVLDYVGPLFPNLTALPPLPEQLSGRITYDAADDTYMLARGDEGLIEIQLAANYSTQDNGRRVIGSLIYLETGAALCSFQADLTRVDTMFGYAISDLTLL